MFHFLRFHFSIAAIVAVACVAFGGCGSKAPVEVAVEPPGSLTVFYTCDTRGHISPCNCTAGVAGGIARRKTYIDENRTDNALIVDAGNVAAGPREWELLELEYILKGYDAIGYDAVNVGAREASFPVETLRELKTKHPYFVSANVEDDTGELVFEPFRVKTLSNGYRVAITGVVQNTLLPDEIGAGMHIAPPADAIEKMLPELKAAGDFIVVLAFTDEATMKSLAERFFEIDAIVGGDVEQPSANPVQVNQSIVAYNTDKGKAVGRMNVQFIDGHAVVAENEIAMLLEDVADDPAMVDLAKELVLEQVRNNYPTEKDDEEGLSRISASE
ncbi:MAG: hypothetical protein KJ060_08175 [Candidatus Hydrogenedentes bacterium]|nr:hypothetical protein [Candidatus Hydrogenedentota bacterium]